MGLVTLQGDIGIEHSAALKDALAAHLRGKSRTVDGSAVERVHAAGLQLLAAWWRDRDAAGLQTGWSACSDTLRAAARALGLEDALGLAQAAAEDRTIVEKDA